MRVLASTIAVVAIGLPCDAGALPNRLHQAPPSVSLLMLDAALTDRQLARRGAPLAPILAVAPTPAGFKPLRPSLALLHFTAGGAPRVRARFMGGVTDEDIAATPTASADYWRDFTGAREMPNPPPTPGSYTDQMIVLSFRDFGRRPSMSVTGGMAGTALQILGADATVRLR